MSCSDSFLAYFASFLFFDKPHHSLFGRFSDLVRIVSVDKSASGQWAVRIVFWPTLPRFCFLTNRRRGLFARSSIHSCFRPASGTLPAGQWSFRKVLARYSDRFCCTQKNICTMKILVFVLLTKSWARAKKYLQYIPSLCYVHIVPALLNRARTKILPRGGENLSERHTGRHTEGKS